MRRIIILFCLGFTAFLKAQVVYTEMPFSTSIMFSNAQNQGLEWLTEKGYYQYNFKMGQVNPMPIEGLETLAVNQLSNQTYLHLNAFGKTFFLLNGGGELYSLSNGIVVREDFSFAHQNQFGGHFFSDQENLFYYGGYGHFRSKDFFIFYNWPTSDWQIVLNNNVVIPEARSNANFEATYDQVYIAGGVYAAGKEEPRFLTDVFSFDLKQKKFKNLGTLNPILQNVNFQWFTNSDYDFSFFLNTNHELVRSSISNNKFVVYNNFDSYLKYVSSPLIVQKDSLYYQTFHGTKKFLHRIALKDLGSYKGEEGLLYVKELQKAPFFNSLLVGFGLLVLLFILYKIFGFVDMVKRKKQAIKPS